MKAILQQQPTGLTYAQERQIKVTAAVLYGSADHEMSATDARETAARLRSNRVLVLAGAHHLAMLPAPQLLVDALTEVLSVTR